MPVCISWVFLGMSEYDFETITKDHRKDVQEPRMRRYEGVKEW